MARLCEGTQDSDNEKVRSMEIESTVVPRMYQEKEQDFKEKIHDIQASNHQHGEEITKLENLLTTAISNMINSSPPKSNDDNTATKAARNIRKLGGGPRSMTDERKKMLCTQCKSVAHTKMECRKSRCTGDHCEEYHSWANEKKATCPGYQIDKEKRRVQFNDGVINMLTLTEEDDENSNASRKHPEENDT